ncbi:MAG: hypothetical protein LBE25_06230 [Arthrobacter sp.]|jgi:hypothetical protein|nr:hypothetical protein [Arthrobacter sp.]
MTVVLPEAFEDSLTNLLDPTYEAVHVKRLGDYMAGGGYTGAAFEALTVAGAHPDRIDASDLGDFCTG